VTSLQATPSIEQIFRAQIAPTSDPRRFADAADLFSKASRMPAIVNGIPSFAPHLVDDARTGFSQIEIEEMEDSQRGSFYWKARNNTIAFLLSRYFPDCRRVLDIGCGTGYVTELLCRAAPEATVYATDTSVAGLTMTAQRLENRALFIHLDAADIPFRNAFDLITTFDVLEHIEDDQSVINETYRALKQGGGVIHFVPQHPWTYSPADRTSRHFRRYATTELQQKLRRAGFEITFTSSFIFFLFPLYVASRLKSKITGHHSHEAERQKAAWIGRLLDSVQDVELALLKRKWSYPCGVSRAVVAVRR